LKSGSGIVIEVNNKKATLLMKDGTFVTVRIPPGKHPSIGREYQASYFSNRKRSLFVLPSLAALFAFVLLSGLVPTGSKSAAAAYVSFDINPSLEVGVDDDMRVIQIHPFNDEAKHLLKEYDMTVDKDFSFEEFAEKLIKAYETEGYMNNDHSMLITTVPSEEGNEKTVAALDQAVDTIVKDTVVKYPVQITVSESNTDTRNKATTLGVSPGKYTAFQKANNGKPLNKEKIKEVHFQELKVSTASSTADKKAIPHPRKIKAESNNNQKDINSTVSKNAVRKQKTDHVQNNKPKKAQEKPRKPQKEVKLKEVKLKEVKLKEVLNHDNKQKQNRNINHNVQRGKENINRKALDNHNQNKNKHNTNQNKNKHNNNQNKNKHKH
jgi:hypothetical protein